MQSSGIILLSCIRYAYGITLGPTAAESEACLLLTAGDPLGVSSYFSVMTFGIMPGGGSDKLLATNPGLFECASLPD